METEDHKEVNSPERKEKSRSSRRSRSRSHSYSRRSRSRDRSSRRDRPQYEYDDGSTNRNEGNTLYIGNISSRCEEAQLREEFEKFGPVSSIKIPKDTEGLNRGFAFLSFEAAADAKKAMDERVVLFDRVLTIELSHRNTGYKPTPGVYLGKQSLSYSRKYDGHSRRHYDDYDDRHRRHHSHHSHRSRSRDYSSRDYSRDRDRKRYDDDRRDSRRYDDRRDSRGRDERRSSRERRDSRGYDRR